MPALERPATIAETRSEAGGLDLAESDTLDPISPYRFHTARSETFLNEVKAQ